MRASVPTIQCDAEDGLCGAWDLDNYEMTATTVNGVRITADQRAPGWRNGHEDLCPKHSGRRSMTYPPDWYSNDEAGAAAWEQWHNEPPSRLEQALDNGYEPEDPR